MRLRSTLFLTLWMVLATALGQAQEGGQASPSPAGSPNAGVRSSLLLIESDVAGEIRDGTAFVVKSGNETLALTSYEAVRGASTIHALVPRRGLVMAHLLKFAPEANLALLKVAVSNLPAVRLGDSDLVRPEDPIEMTTASPLREGNLATAMSPISRKGKVGNVLPRPGGTVLQLAFDMALTDDSTGAPVVATNSNEVVGLALSRSSAGNDAARTAIPINLAGAFGYDLAKSTAATASVRVLDGTQAPVVGGPGGQGIDETADVMGYVIAVGLGLVIVAVIAVVVLRRREKFVPFAVLPKLPEGAAMAFVDARGNLLPMDRDPIRIGRAADNTWSFNDASVSNYHARIKKNTRGSGYEVEDLRSTNGTWVRDRRIGGAETITPGSLVRFGKIEVMLMTRAQSTTGKPSAS